MICLRGGVILYSNNVTHKAIPKKCRLFHTSTYPIGQNFNEWNFQENLERFFIPACRRGGLAGAVARGRTALRAAGVHGALRFDGADLSYRLDNIGSMSIVGVEQKEESKKRSSVERHITPFIRRHEAQ